MSVGVCLVTPYPPGRSELGGGGWVDRRLYSSLIAAGADLSLVTVTGPSGRWSEHGITGTSAGDVPLEIRGSRRHLARVAAAMLRSTKPYLACKFTAFDGWPDAVELLRQEARGRTVVTSGWPPLLLASAAAVPVGLHIAHNAEYLIAARHAPRPLRLLGEVQRLRRLERQLLHLPTNVSVLSRLDQQRVATWHIAAEQLPLPLSPDATATRAEAVGLLGKASWPPNAEAFATLLGPVHDALSRLGSNVRFVLGGHGTEAFTDHPRVVRAGPVGDLNEFYGQIGVVVVPRLGTSTGISVKVLEAAEHGVPAIMPRSLADAIDPGGPWITAEDPHAVAQAIADWAEGSTPPPDVGSWVAAHLAERTAEYILERVQPPSTAAGASS